MKYILSITVLLFIGNLTIDKAQAQAQDLANTGSFYSGFGFGAPADLNSPNTMGMGLSGVSNYSGFAPNSSNPAHWGLSGFTQGTVSVGMTNYNASDAFDASRNALFEFENFQLVLPIWRNKVGVSASFNPITKSDFHRTSSGNFQPIDGIALDDVEYATSTRGSGGINQFEFGAGIRLIDNISVGYSMGAYLLSQKQEVTAAFSDISYRRITYNRDIDGYAFGHRFGLFANKSSLFGSEDQISAGATLSLPVTFDAERSVTSFRTVNGRRTLIEVGENDAGSSGTIKLPLEINAGLTYNLNRFVNFSSELLIQNWNEAQYSYNLDQQSYFKDRLKAGFGIQYHPYRTEQDRGFLSNFKYSVGSSYDTGHLNINGKDIDTLYLNAGIGLFSRQASSSIDLSFQYGIRGTESSNLVKENIWGFKLSLNLAEYMFVRPKFQ